MGAKKLALLSVVALMAASGWAQYQGRIEGKVMDTAGNPLDRVEVSIVSSKLGSQKFNLKTDREGRFTQIGLSPGFYVASFKREGFAQRSVEVKVNIAEAALVSFAKCIAIKPEYADAYYQLGTLYIGQNKVKEAVESLEKFLELAPGHEKAGVARQLLDYLKK